MRLRARHGGFLPFAGTRALLATAALLACAFVLLATLVAAGALRGVDEFSVEHLMPALRPGSVPSGSMLAGLYDPLGPRPTWWWVTVLGLWLYPCSVLVSGLVVAAVAAWERRRGRSSRALVLLAAWCAGNAIELVGKGFITRPALDAPVHGTLVAVLGFGASFPSGHMIRGTVLLAALLTAWPGARPWLVAWYLTVGPFLVISAAHTPTDVVGGLLVGWAILAAGSWLLAARPRVARGDGRLA